jgi:hypothetical protein
MEISSYDDCFQVYNCVVVVMMMDESPFASQLRSGSADQAFPCEGVPPPGVPTGDMWLLGIGTSVPVTPPVDAER